MAFSAIYPIAQRSEYDCAQCCLAMVLQVGYEEVGRVFSATLRRGMTADDLKKTAKKLGYRLESYKGDKWDRNPDDSPSVLFVSKGRGAWHAVVSFCGVIYNPADATLWEREAFLGRGFKVRNTFTPRELTD